MPNYVQDPDNPDKLVPGPQPDNYYDRTVMARNISRSISEGGNGLYKQPSSVYITSNRTRATHPVGFYFGTSASFAELDLSLTGNGNITASKNSKQISGSGTSFTTELKAGDKIEIVSASFKQVRIIDSILSNTSMSITTNWTGNTYSTASVTRRRSFMSENYETHGLGTGSFQISPIAYSASNAEQVVFIYRGGLDGSPRPI